MASIAFLLTTLALSARESLIVPLEKYDVRCFHELGYSGGELFAEFEIVEGRRNLEFTVRSPAGKLLYFSHAGDHKGFGKVYMKTKTDGIYKVCLDNQGSPPKNVRISLEVEVPWQTRQLDPAEEIMDEIIDSLDRVSTTLQGIQNDQDFLATRERIDSEYNEYTSSMVWYLSFFQVVVLVISSVGQLRYLRSLFINRHSRGV
eukprot:TRINITY_DN35409_c0_g1_i1.p1 TRINITY_DN35409_c0_g1~~TRINITY_DN35409_c0_g1_i1.p1  ORF type:complete len:203 (+),score=33.65 TRINITY_DN35409_c0_g1_i1:107-715(+)